MIFCNSAANSDTWDGDLLVWFECGYSFTEYHSILGEVAEHPVLCTPQFPKPIEYFGYMAMVGNVEPVNGRPLGKFGAM